MPITIAPPRSASLLKTGSSIRFPAHYPALDSLRGLAALSVFLGHFLGTCNEDNPLIQAIRKSPIAMLCNASSAVLLFFVLSGFVLALPYINKERPLPLLSFYVKRVSRIYPAFAFSIILALFFQQYLFNAAAMHPFSGWIKSLWTWDIRYSFKEIRKTFGLGIIPFNLRIVNPVFWSLVVEMKMSLLLPFFVLIARKLNAPLNILLLLVLIFKNGINSGTLFGLFYMGILLAKYKDNLLSFIQRFPPLILIGIAVVLYSTRYLFHLESHRGVIILYMVGMGASIFILMLLQPSRIANLFSSKPLHLFGKWSYSFYLLHIPFLLVFCTLFSNNYTLSLIYILACTFIGTTLISAVSYQYIELPFLVLGKRLVEKYKRYDHIRL
ncbi:acyltransferase family protein [Flavisolibacter tropicus]|uniref:Acyltransferase 3 domain-containing protein n=1 Tax=Flavisolibacter tropicus TaxID=1492898 RepID=A0A172TZ78_9BACT|nr:acyltransferase [Flavisolibacter tropicus]ANE52409.1 hypothetical protein SY85_19895 [Flavisolibacter tropicus]